MSVFRFHLGVKYREEYLLVPVKVTPVQIDIREAVIYFPAGIGNVEENGHQPGPLHSAVQPEDSRPLPDRPCRIQYLASGVRTPDPAERLNISRAAPGITQLKQGPPLFKIDPSGKVLPGLSTGGDCYQEENSCRSRSNSSKKRLLLQNKISSLRIISPRLNRRTCFPFPRDSKIGMPGFPPDHLRSSPLQPQSRSSGRCVQLFLDGFKEPVGIELCPSAFGTSYNPDTAAAQLQVEQKLPCRQHLILGAVGYGYPDSLTDPLSQKIREAYG